MKKTFSWKYLREFFRILGKTSKPALWLPINFPVSKQVWYKTLLNAKIRIKYFHRNILSIISGKQNTLKALTHKMHLEFKTVSVKLFHTFHKNVQDSAEFLLKQWTSLNSNHIFSPLSNASRHQSLSTEQITNGTQHKNFLSILAKALLYFSHFFCSYTCFTLSSWIIPQIVPVP